MTAPLPRVVTADGLRGSAMFLSKIEDEPRRQRQVSTHLDHPALTKVATYVLDADDQVACEGDAWFVAGERVAPDPARPGFAALLERIAAALTAHYAREAGRG